MPAPPRSARRAGPRRSPNTISRSSLRYCSCFSFSAALSAEERAPGHIEGLIQGNDFVQVAHQREVFRGDDAALHQLRQRAADDPDGSHSLKRHTLHPLILDLGERYARADETSRLHVASSHAGNEHVPNPRQPVWRLTLAAEQFHKPTQLPRRLAEERGPVVIVAVPRLRLALSVEYALHEAGPQSVAVLGRSAHLDADEVGRGPHMIVGGTEEARHLLQHAGVAAGEDHTRIPPYGDLAGDGGT